MVYAGPIVREELKLGSRARGIRLCSFFEEKPLLLVMGGSQGAERINRTVREALRELLMSYQVVHICPRRAPRSDGNGRSCRVEGGFKCDLTESRRCYLS
ncbi:glycosyltransferase [Paenibacillus thiaminolyticus]|uniref:glycosyltransferase n=1 Tax=Paenibacillus thiaminolyticus TaxID=49283 RepID=UPI0035A5E7FF